MLPDTMLARMLEEKRSGMEGGIYHKIQVDMAYNSNRIEGSRLSHDQTRYIYETRTVDVEEDAGVIRVDDVIETVNHFQCLDYMLESIDEPLSENLIREVHRILKSSTMWSRVSYNRVGQYKLFANQVGGISTSEPEDVERDMEELLFAYNWKKKKDIRDILDFHVRFEQIHPFQDGNGRVGRLIMFREVLKHGIAPFIIEDSMRLKYYKGLKEWHDHPEYFLETVQAAQRALQESLRYFGIRCD